MPRGEKLQVKAKDLLPTMEIDLTWDHYFINDDPDFLKEIADGDGKFIVDYTEEIGGNVHVNPFDSDWGFGFPPDHPVEVTLAPTVRLGYSGQVSVQLTNAGFPKRPKYIAYLVRFPDGEAVNGYLAARSARDLFGRQSHVDAAYHAEAQLRRRGVRPR
jgi:hypothetical protein